ncbi:MFS transporter [Nannocystis bainbridge]|uniref:MFS transporter n=1 Tax=Nannocystis bainbridge TaxID=2995303 RepID=A0ABT5E8Q4_9BACT|nr:MFS transporter [Nannocystis bainbridge]MDC0722242.1 MFS transporter [Nannocystis bainbridge]
MSSSPLKRPLLLAYAAGSIGSGLFSTVPGLLLLFYLTDTLGVAASLAGLAILIPRIWDIVTDPLVGAWSDRTRSRWGRRRPFLLAGALLLPPGFIALFSAPVGDPSLSFAWVLVAFVWATGAFTLFQIPYASMPAEMTADYHERTRVVAHRMAFLPIGILAGGALAPMLIKASGGGPAGYRVMAVTLAIIAAVAMSVAFFGTRSAPQLPAPSESAGLREQIRVALSHRPYRRLLLGFAVQNIGIGAVLAAVPYYCHYTLRGGEAAVTVLFVSLVGPAIVAMPLWMAVSRRFGKRVGYILATVLFAGCALSLLSAAPGRLALVAAQVGVLGVGFAGLQVFPFAMLPDLVDDDAAVTNQRREGIFTGLWFVGEKGGLTLGAWLVSQVLATTGFVERRAGELVTQPEAALVGVLVATAVVPAACALLSLPLLFHHVESARNRAT